jgi:hypothetical protein
VSDPNNKKSTIALTKKMLALYGGTQMKGDLYMTPELTNLEQRVARKYPYTFDAWKEMWAWTTDPSHPKYPEEGGRGIRVCDQ